jgi:murein DD-endopeptidase MepM/ murein hydrolase activator NlpD
MPSRRYTIVIADRTTGTTRRLTIRLRPIAVGLIGAFALPVLIGMGMRWSARGEIAYLRSANASLDVENTSYRAATETLTGQIESLQAAISDLGARSQLNPETAEALRKLPAIVKNRAVGGSSVNGALLSPSISSPEDTFGILRDLLTGLESHLNIVRRDVERREALGASTPSIWPVHGWLSAGFGMRADPFTGETEYHPGLDISADKGTPVYATASGTVESAGPSGEYGNLIVLAHGFGLMSRYAHLSRFAVQAGQRVTRGEVIGYVGATGRATGPHLHYEVLANGKLLNPLSLLITKPQP